MSENLSRGTRDFSRYDSMATEELEEILRLDAEAPMGQESDEELLFYVMGVLADRRNNTQFTGKTAREAYESFKQHYLPREDHIESVPKAKHRPICWLRSLTAAAAALVVVVGLSVTAKAFGQDILYVVAKWAEETFSFVGEEANVHEPAASDEEHYESLKQVLIEGNIDPDLLPGWMPEGYSQEDITIDENPVQKTYVAYYLNEDLELMISVKSYINTEPEQIEKSGNLLEIYSASGTDYYIFRNNRFLQAVWLVDSYECYIAGELALEELKAMIDSIGKG